VFYEAILDDDSPRDRIGQIRFAAYLAKSSVRAVRGMWVPERSREQHLASAMARGGGGVNRTEETALPAPPPGRVGPPRLYLTEDEGRLRKIFPVRRGSVIDAFQERHATDELPRRLSYEQTGAVVFADDGREVRSLARDATHVLQAGWLRRFCEC